MARRSTICLSCKRPDRTTDIITYLALGYATKEIADKLSITNKTVEYWWQKAKKQQGFRCYQDATRYAIRQHLIKL